MPRSATTQTRPMEKRLRNLSTTGMRLPVSAVLPGYISVQTGRPSPIEQHREDHLIEIRPMVLGKAALSEGLSARSLEIEAGRVHEHEIERAEEIAQRIKNFQVGSCNSQMLTGSFPRNDSSSERIDLLSSKRAGPQLNLSCQRFIDRIACGRRIHERDDMALPSVLRRDEYILPAFHFLHADARLLAQPNRNLVLDPRHKIARRAILQERSRTNPAHQRLHLRLQQNRHAFRLDKIRGPSKTHQTMFREPMIPNTSTTLADF